MNGWGQPWALADRKGLLAAGHMGGWGDRSNQVPECIRLCLARFQFNGTWYSLNSSHSRQYSDTNKGRRVYSELVQKELELDTTTCTYNSTFHYQATNILADKRQKYGQRAIIGKSGCMMNFTSHNWEESVEQCFIDDRQSIEWRK